MRGDLYVKTSVILRHLLQKPLNARRTLHCRVSALLLILILIALAAASVTAGIGRDRGPQETVSTWVEEWDPEAGRWVRVESSKRADKDARSDDDGLRAHHPPDKANSARRPPPRIETADPSLQANRKAANRAQLARYGPFVVKGSRVSVLDGTTDHRTPAQFDAMLRDFPRLDVLRMVDAPGTVNDIANLELGRRIRQEGLKTVVPPGGSVRSGAVDLFIAGEPRTIAPNARFAVHSWEDLSGREAVGHPAGFARPRALPRLLRGHGHERGARAGFLRDDQFGLAR